MQGRFDEQFCESEGAPIAYRGQLVHQMHRVEIQAPTRLSVQFVSFNKIVRQALRLAVDGGLASINGIESDSFILWSHSSPTQTDVAVTPKADFAQLMLWNAFDDGSGAVESWTRNCGILIETSPSGTTLRCSDGVGDPNFEDLVVRIRTM